MPHGDDFRYESASEWDKQFGNLKKIMEYMNNDETMRVQVGSGCHFSIAVQIAQVAKPMLLKWARQHWQFGRQ